jgi:uncharacterized protein YndB with AHSA1/START domain
MPRSVSGSIQVAAAPEQVFALLADPRRHCEIDGSGMLRSAVAGPHRLTLGATFGMRMQWGVPYLVRSTVVEFEENRRIGWRHFGRHIWRYELEPVPGGTAVTETFDYAPAIAPPLLELAGFPARNQAAITATLQRLQDLFGPVAP